MRLRCLVFVLAAAICLPGNRTCQAGFTFLGPTPYLSAADSPFAEHLGKPNFYLEDFEDGELNTPGIFQPLHPVFGTAFQGVVMGPSEFTDSVDSDDGIIDGSGTAGYSFRSRALFTNQTIPQRNEVVFEFEFDALSWRSLPTVLGFVWTDGPEGIDYFRPGLDLLMVVTDYEGNVYVSPSIKRSPNMSRNGLTSEDVFLGVTSDTPITQVTLGGIYYGEGELMPYLEIDHVQYGRLTIPEPGMVSFLIFSANFFVTGRLPMGVNRSG